MEDSFQSARDISVLENPCDGSNDSVTPSGFVNRSNLAGDPYGSGGLQHSSAEGVAHTVPLSVFCGFSPKCDVNPCCVQEFDLDGYSKGIYTGLDVPVTIKMRDEPSIYSDTASLAVDYFFHQSPIHCESSPIKDVGLDDGFAPSSDNLSFYSRKSNSWYFRPCGVQCTGRHDLEGCRSQLNPCVFFDYCFGMNIPDPNAEFIFEGVRDGFKIVDYDFAGSYFCQNYQSVLSDESRLEMNDIVLKELALGKVSRSDSFPQCVHALGAITKASGGIRPITDCKRPLGFSINNYMNSVCEDFSYISMDDVCQSITPGCYFSVLDIKSAYRSVNVFPDHRQVQGFMWDSGNTGVELPFVDNCLCFGLKSAPFLYTQITEFIMRTMNRLGYSGVYGYLDDFIVVAPTEESCKKAMSILIDVLQNLGFVIAWKKVVIPSQLVTYLGISIDSVNMTLSLPTHKVMKLKSLVYDFRGKSKTSVKELQVLSGHLAHASTVVRGGRTFSRRVINFLKYISSSTTMVSLPDWFTDDLEWWIRFVEIFNGSAKIISDIPYIETPLETDSSMTGFAARWGRDWILGPWHSPNPPGGFPFHHWSVPPSEYNQDFDKNLLELWPVVAAIQRWGHLWKGCKIRLYTDNTQVMYMINTGRSSSIRCMFWLRELFWYSVIYNFHLVASHVRSEDNTVPDFLSRFFDPNRKLPLPSDLIEGLCCYRSGRVEDPIA